MEGRRERREQVRTEEGAGPPGNSPIVVNWASKRASAYRGGKLKRTLAQTHNVHTPPPHRCAVARRFVYLPGGWRRRTPWAQQHHHQLGVALPQGARTRGPAALVRPPLNPISYFLFPTSYFLFPISSFLNPIPKPYTLNSNAPSLRTYTTLNITLPLRIRDFACWEQCALQRRCLNPTS